MRDNWKKIKLEVMTSGMDAGIEEIVSVSTRLVLDSSLRINFCSLF